MATLHCEIMTPEGSAFSGDVEMIVVPGSDGELGVLPRHQPIVARLDVGEVRLRISSSEWCSFAISDGYFSMQGERALVLVEGAVASDAIDTTAVQVLVDDARARLAQTEGDSAEHFRAQRDLEFAENQIAIAGR